MGGYFSYFLIDRKINLFKFFIVFFVITMAVSAYFEIYFFSSSELQKIADKNKIHIVFEHNAKEIYIYDLIKKLDKDKRIKSVDYISPEQAQAEFFQNYQSFSSDLLTVNPFPAIVQFTLKKEFFDNDNISLLIKKYCKSEFVDDVKYKRDFIDSYSLIKKHFYNYLLYFSILFALILIFLILLTTSMIREDLRSFDIKGKIMLSNYLLVGILLSMFFSNLITIPFWYFFKNYFLWLNLMKISSVVAMSTFTGVGFYFLSIIFLLFSKAKRETE
jgi:hypothetical protein